MAMECTTPTAHIIGKSEDHVSSSYTYFITDIYIHVHVYSVNEYSRVLDVRRAPHVHVDIHIQVVHGLQWIYVLTKLQ